MTIFISAGEVSGDKQGSLLSRALKEAQPDIRLLGLGGPMMEKAGVTLLDDISTLSTMGFFESARPDFIARKLHSFDVAKAFLKENAVDLILFIDNQGFNLIFAEWAKAHGYATAYYFPPHVGIWGRKTAKNVKESIDLVITQFQTDYDVYKEYGANVIFPGHPFADLPLHPSLPPSVKMKINSLGKKFTVALMPGSRHQEIRALTPVFAKTMRPLYEALNGAVGYVIPIANAVFKPAIEKTLSRYKKTIGDIPFVFLENEETDFVYAAADACILSSGTASLLAAIYGKPMAITYKIALPTYLLGKYALKLKYIGMPNILADAPIAPELIEFDCAPKKITAVIANYLNDATAYETARTELLKTRGRLGGEGALKRTARAILDYFG